MDAFNGQCYSCGGTGIGRENALVRRAWMWSAIHAGDMGIMLRIVRPRRAKAKAESWAKARAKMVWARVKAQEEQKDGTREEKDQG